MVDDSRRRFSFVALSWSETGLVSGGSLSSCLLDFRRLVTFFLRRGLDEPLEEVDDTTKADPFRGRAVVFAGLGVVYLSLLALGFLATGATCSSCSSLESSELQCVKSSSSSSSSSSPSEPVADPIASQGHLSAWCSR